VESYVDVSYQDAQGGAYVDLSYQDAQEIPEKIAYRDVQEWINDNVVHLQRDTSLDHDEQHVLDAVHLLFNSGPEMDEKHHCDDIQDDTNHQSNYDRIECGYNDKLLQETINSKQSQEGEHRHQSFINTTFTNQSLPAMSYGNTTLTQAMTFGNITFTHQSIPTNNMLPYIIPVR